ncbi:alpha/beta fold hydrolase [Paenibacillus sp. strain BS8-2]
MNTVISKDGTAIAYDKTGQGPALILVAGAFSYRKFPGTIKLAQLLSERFTVFNYDRRGRGDSGDSKEYAIEREIEDLEAMIEAAGGSAYVWGLSSGAALALHAAASGAAITKLALHEPPFIVRSVDRKPPREFLQHLKLLIAQDRRADAVRYFMTKGMGAPSFVVSMMHIMPGVWRRLLAVANTLPYDAALIEGHTHGKPLNTEQWSHVAMKTIVLAGTESPESMQRGAEAVASALPDARLVCKKGLGHMRQMPAEAINTELRAFFTSHSPT